MNEGKSQIVIEKGEGLYISLMIWPGKFERTKAKTFRDFIVAFYYIIKWCFFTRSYSVDDDGRP